MNLVVLLGNLGRDPEMRYTSAGNPVTEFNLAVNEGSGEKRTTIWVHCVCWDKTAEIAAEHLRKGSRVIVEGTLGLDIWKDKETEKTRERVKVTVRRLTFVSSAPKQEGTAPVENEDLTDLPF